jgi:hypothetical protein
MQDASDLRTTSIAAIHISCQTHPAQEYSVCFHGHDDFGQRNGMRTVHVLVRCHIGRQPNQ